MAMVILGIDPGIEGGCAIYGETLAVCDVPTAGEDAKRRVNARALLDWIQSHAPTQAFIENVGSMPDQGVASSFRFGRAAGALEATVACAGVPITLVAPVTWKKMFMLQGPDKEQARVLAIQRFPLMAGQLARKKDHQRAEALLIAYYGWRTLGGFSVEAQPPARAEGMLI
jgi:Holliday junction resolvasome RuvABC endonuclease subunit